jgi:hypothetical protein
MVVTMTKRTLDQPIIGRPLELHRGGEGSFVKPGELIEVREMEPLTLQDRRVWNLLMVNAWDRITEDTEHVISKSILRGSHDSTDRLADTIRRLMSTLVEARIVREGKVSTLRVQLLGPTVESKDRDGLLHVLPELRDIMLHSRHWGRLQAQVMLSLSSKYSLILYEMVQKRANLTMTMEDFTLEDLRRILGVPQGKLGRYQDFRRKVIDPAVTEVAALSDCHVKATPIKSGRSVTGYRLQWVKKDQEGLKRAYAELQKHKAGRRSRLMGTVDMTLPVLKPDFDDEIGM